MIKDSEIVIDTQIGVTRKRPTKYIDQLNPQK